MIASVKDRIDRAARSVQGQTPTPEWIKGNESVASPRASTPADARWYLPTLGERLQLMGWRNLLWILPLVLVAMPMVLFGAWFAAWAGFWYWKLLILALGLPITVLIDQARKAVRLRTDPFCIHCGYSAEGLPDGHPCPECASILDRALSEEYRRDPHWFIRRQKMSAQLPAADKPFEAGTNRVDNADGV
jgi:hypothetical protein